MLVGIALSEGKLQSLGDRAEKYVTELEGSPYGETAIRHLLTMSSGVRFTETYSGSDDVATLARLSVLGESDGGAATVMPFRTRDRPSGERFHYSSAETQVLGLVLRAATGEPLADYLSEKIWQPMGAEADASWIIDQGGYETAYFGVNATLRDYAQLGMLLANDGALDGRQIIPPAGYARRLHRRRSSSSPGERARSSAMATRHGSCPARGAGSCCEDCEGRVCSWTRRRKSSWSTRRRATSATREWGNGLRSGRES